jgi:Fe-S cluster assembly iron-binding protein IscA
MIFTEAAAERVKELIIEQEEEPTTSLRVFLEGG